MTATPAPEARRDDGGFALFVAVAIVVAVFLLSVIRMRPPAPAGPDAPDGAFSATRAFESLKTVLADGVPHPTGSEANHAVRDRIVARLRAVGLAPEVERRFVVAASHHRAAWVENIVARVKGREPGPAVVLSAHYDSVAAGPGASDDGMGVATILEVARALTGAPALRRDVVLLFTDGEEIGLLGASAWVRAHGTDDVAAIVNVDARGTTGPSLMFETGTGSAATVAAWSSGAARPVTSSLFAAVYREMPNDTDFSVFLDAGVPGVNFANVGGVQRYHTPLDSLAHFDVRTLQQHGDNALAAVRGLAETQGDLRDAGESVWFDVMGAFVVRWPAEWTVALAAVALLLAVGAAVAAVRRDGVCAKQILGGAVGAFAVIVGSVAAAWGLGELLGAAGSLPGPYVADVRGPIAVAAGAAVLVAGAVGVLAARVVTSRGLFAGCVLVLAAIGMALAIRLPGGSYIATVPALAGGVAACAVAARRGGSVAVPALILLVVGSVLWLPLVPLLADALGVRPLLVVAVPFALTATALVSFIADGGRRRTCVAIAGIVLLVGGSIATLVAEPVTAAAPRPIVVHWHRDEASSHAHWFVRAMGDEIPEAMRAAAEFEDETERILPWDPVVAWPAAAPPVPEIVAPVLQGLQIRDLDGARRITFRLVSRRAAPWMSLVIEPGARLRRYVVGGVSQPPETLRRGTDGPFVLDLWAVPPEGIEFDLEIVGKDPVIAYVADATWGLPPGADALARARPANCVTIGAGDQTIVHRKLRL